MESGLEIRQFVLMNRSNAFEEFSLRVRIGLICQLNFKDFDELSKLIRALVNPFKDTGSLQMILFILQEFPQSLMSLLMIRVTFEDRAIILDGLLDGIELMVRKLSQTKFEFVRLLIVRM